jgi:hypothetical protein
VQRGRPAVRCKRRRRRQQQGCLLGGTHPGRRPLLGPRRSQVSHWPAALGRILVKAESLTVSAVGAEIGL